MSAKVAGNLTTAAKTVSLRLGPKAWSTQRDRARLVVEYSAGGNAWTVASVALSRKSGAASK